MEIPQQFLPLKVKRVLVTGAAGFIGGALFRRLASYGVPSRGTVLLESEMQQMQSEGFDVRVLDLLSDEPWDDVMTDVDIVFHVAAIFQEVEKTREEYEKANRDAVVKLARAAARAGVERFVHCSTVGVHGAVVEVPATENTPFNPMDEYHETKLAGELALLDWGKTDEAGGMIITVNRPAMVYGPGDLRMLKMFSAIASGRFAMIGSGKTLAHLGYIEDQIDSFLLGALAPSDQVHLESFNIASGEPMSLNELADKIAAATGSKVPGIKIPVSLVWCAALACEIIWKPLGKKPPLFRRRVGFFTHNRAFDLSKARRLLDYNPKWEAEEGIRTTVEWYRGQGLLS